MIRGKLPETSKASQLLDTIRTLSPLLNMEKGPWVAGGSIRRILKDIPTGGDIDIFFGKNTELSIDIVKEFKKILKKPTLSMSDLCKSTKENEFKKVENIEHNPNVQLIMFEQYENVYELLESFDYTICIGATDGIDWIADERMFSDHEKKLIRYGNENKAYSNQVHRLIKYCYTHSFNPVPGLLSRVLKLDNLNEYYDFIDHDLRLINKQEDYLNDD